MKPNLNSYGEQMNYQNLITAIDVIAKLRDPNEGCPWDLKQTHKSLLKYLIEESYEYIQAVEENNHTKMQEELGDVLLQVLLHSQIASEGNHFNIDSVASVLANKMIHRHPHVFGNDDTKLSADEVITNWKKLKAKEKKKQFHIETQDAYAPSLLASFKIGQKSKEINFDWDKIEDVLAKVDEELDEVKDEIKIDPHSNKTKEELGDLLFSVAQLARHCGFDPEETLKEANLKFITRINKVEKSLENQGLNMSDMDTSELEKTWQKVKKK